MPLSPGCLAKYIIINVQIFVNITKTARCWTHRTAFT
nr:MAG TPA: hypothetical protein [Caudoviricetes sp.]